MEDWIRERAIKAYEEKQKDNKEKLDALFKRLMWEIVGIDVGYVEYCKYTLGEYNFCLRDPSSDYSFQPATTKLYVSYQCPYSYSHGGFNYPPYRIVEDIADWGKFILNCEEHRKWCGKEAKEKAERLEAVKKRGWFRR